MPLKYRYAIFITLLHAVITALAYYILKDNKWFFLIAEVGILTSLYLSYKLYIGFLRPIELMKTGVNAIKDEDYNVRFLKTGSREVNGLIEVFNKMLDKLGEERIRTQEQAYVLESLIEASPIGMIMLDYDDHISDINPAARALLGTHEVRKGQPIDQINHPLITGLLQIPVGQSEIITTESISKYRCQINTIIHRGFPQKFIMIEELSKELLITEKRAYEQVIRMMAHEVNNSMGAINSILQTIADFAFDQPESSDYAESLQIAMQRNTDLALFMKRFADVVRVPAPNKRHTSLNDIVTHSVSVMSSYIADHNIQVQINATKDVMLNIDKVLIEQVVVNILKNAVESIGSDGTIQITINPSSPQLTIIDNGAGITDEDAQRLFTPFFSTKPTGQGVGLMLIREILVGHDASFRLHTDATDGLTRFKIGFK